MITVQHVHSDGKGGWNAIEQDFEQKYQAEAYMRRHASQAHRVKTVRCEVYVLLDGF